VYSSWVLEKRDGVWKLGSLLEQVTPWSRTR
jgi:hypothetical protein